MIPGSLTGSTKYQVRPVVDYFYCYSTVILVVLVVVLNPLLIYEFNKKLRIRRYVYHPIKGGDPRRICVRRNNPKSIIAR